MLTLLADECTLYIEISIVRVMIFALHVSRIKQVGILSPIHMMQDGCLDPNDVANQGHVLHGVIGWPLVLRDPLRGPFSVDAMNYIYTVYFAERWGDETQPGKAHTTLSHLTDVSLLFFSRDRFNSR